MSSRALNDASAIFRGAIRLAASSFNAQLDRCPSSNLSKIVSSHSPHERPLKRKRWSEETSEAPRRATEAVDGVKSDPLTSSTRSVDSSWLAAATNPQKEGGDIAPTIDQKVEHIVTPDVVSFEVDYIDSPALYPTSIPPVITQNFTVPSGVSSTGPEWASSPGNLDTSSYQIPVTPEEASSTTYKSPSNHISKDASSSIPIQSEDTILADNSAQQPKERPPIAVQPEDTILTEKPTPASDRGGPPNSPQGIPVQTEDSILQYDSDKTSSRDGVPSETISVQPEDAVLSDVADEAIPETSSKTSSSAIPVQPEDAVLSEGPDSIRQQGMKSAPSLSTPFQPESTVLARNDRPAAAQSTSSEQEPVAQSDVQPNVVDSAVAVPVETAPTRTLKASKVPSSRLGRLFHYGGLAAGLGYGAASEAIRRSFGPKQEGTSSLLMTEANVRRLVDKLGRMRGAALKLGQFMSIQDSKMLPPQIEDMLRQIQDSANYMPQWQTERVLTSNIGDNWREHFAEFDMTPFAAASIGQVHRATLSPSSPLAATYGASIPLAVKVQFPGVRSSIDSDLSNLKWVLAASAVLPKGLYLDNTIRVMQRELDEECDYVREAQCGVRMRDLLEKKGGKGLQAPQVIEELCGEMVLTTEFMEGEALGKAVKYDQSTRDDIGEGVLKLCLRELFHFRFMQTDPNWSNFLYSNRTKKIQLIDFGATRGYSQTFVDNFWGVINAAIDQDEDACLRYSRDLGYLTGEEIQDMLSAHVASLVALGTPFRQSSPDPFPFDTLGPPITTAIRAQIPIMLKHRLTPPPEETYSLNRKLSGAFLLCERLGSRVKARSVLEEVREGMQKWKEMPGTGKDDMPPLKKLADLR